MAMKPEDAAKEFSKFLRRHATVDMLSKAQKPYQVAQLVAHNAAFDGPRLSRFFRNQNAFLPASRRVYCTLQRAFWHFHENPHCTPPADYKLGTLCEYFGVSHRKEEAHDALADVRATLGLYAAIVSEAGRERSSQQVERASTGQTFVATSA